MYLPSPAIPPGLSPTVWRRMLRMIEREVNIMLTTGRPPRATEALALQATLEALTSDPVAARTGAWVLHVYAQQLRNTRTALLGMLQGHASASTAEAAAILAAAGWKAIPNTGAVGAAVARGGLAITRDWDRLAGGVQRAIVNELLAAIAGGKNPNEIADILSRIGGMTYSRALNIARTELADIYAQARLGYMRESGNFHAWWWKARPDACALCQTLHGTVHPIGMPRLAHHQCRCVVVPLIRGFNAPAPVRSLRDVLAMADPPLPASWLPHLRDRRDLVALIGVRDNPGWRPAYALKSPNARRTRAAA